MKKIFLLSVMFLFTLSGCLKTSPAVTPVTTGLNFTAEISYLGNTYENNINIDKNGNLEMINPSLKDTKYFFWSNKIILTHNNLSYETEISSFSSLPIDFLYTVFKTISKQNKKMLYDNENYYISCDCGKYDFTVFFGMSGIPIKIEESNFQITALIKNASISSNQ